MVRKRSLVAIGLALLITLAFIPTTAFAKDGTVPNTIGQIVMSGTGADAVKTNKVKFAVNKSYTSKDGGSQTFKFTTTFVEAIDDKGTAMASGAPAAPAQVTISLDGKNTTTGTAQMAEMTFTKPGAYLYEVKEVKETAAGVTYDESSYYVVVYVVYDVDENNETLNTVHVEDVTSWHSEKGTDTDSKQKPALGDLTTTKDTNGESKANSNGTDYGKVDSTRFVNIQESQNIKITKEVKGTLGHTDETFPATVAFTGLTPSTTYTVTGDQSTTPVTSFSSAADGTATVNLTLKDEAVITIENLPIGAKYTVTETNSKAHCPSYTVTSDANPYVQKTGADAKASASTEFYTKNGDTYTKIEDKSTLANDAVVYEKVADDPIIARASGGSSDTHADSLATAQETVDGSDGTVTVAFDNTRTFKNVTGVPFAVIPFGVLMLIGVAVFAASRRKKSSMDII